MGAERATPLAGGVHAHPDLGGDRGVGCASRSAEHDLCSDPRAVLGAPSVPTSVNTASSAEVGTMVNGLVTGIGGLSRT